MLEFEKKILLNKKEYDCLINKYPTVQTVHENYYYDTEDLRFNSMGITYRIRKKNDRFIATKKIHGVENNKNCSREITVIAKNEFDSSAFDNRDLQLKGRMITTRNEFTVTEGVTAMLDKNVYLDTCDYELEVEYLRNARNVVENFIKDLLGDFSAHYDSESKYYYRIKDSRSKSERFFERYKELEKNK